MTRTELESLLLRHNRNTIPKYYTPISTATYKTAAVLIPIIQKEHKFHIILTKRADDLTVHPGQVSFPGGHEEPGESASETALREAQEEIGLPPHEVEILTELGQWPTVSGYLVTPVVGIIKSDHIDWKLDKNEVQSFFEVPLSYTLNLNHYEAKQKEHQNQIITYYHLPYQNYDIWGFTAGILHYLAELNQR